MNYLEDFRDYLTNQKHSSDNTVQSYMRDISQYLSYCTDNTYDVVSADKKVLQRFLEHLSSIGKSESTCSRMLASVRCFYRYLASNNIVKSNPANAIRMHKVEQKLPGVLTTNEVMLLLSQPSGNDYKSIRDKAMLEVLYATGMKVSELIDLSINDVNLQIGIIHMNGKNSERIVPIYPAALKALTVYMANVRPVIVMDGNSDKLFTNMNGLPMSRQGFWKIIKSYSVKAGINKDITPHTLRHSFAAHLLENGAQLKDIKEMLGHSDISSTQIYAKFIKNKYTQAYSKFHPLAK